MSVTIEQPRTAAQRAVDATTKLRELFGFENLKAMSTAIAEATVEEALRDKSYADRIRTLYQELTQLSKGVSGSSRKRRQVKSPTKSKLVAISHVDKIPDPFAPLDPYYLLKIYGSDQLQLALEDYTLSTLKLAAKNLMATHPGTKPESLARIDTVIAYIVEIVTG